MSANAPRSSSVSPLAPWQPGDNVPAPLDIYSCRVEQEWVDYNGHMTEAAYLSAFGWGSDALFTYIGDNDAYRAAGNSFYTVETHIVYEDEAFRLGYIICSHPDATILDKKVIGRKIEDVKNELPFKSWTKEDFDTTENHFNESNWLILQSEYDDVIRVEIGAIINDKVEFDWKF
jgi:hypothetical protein